jgi:hypothetical protein
VLSRVGTGGGARRRRPCAGEDDASKVLRQWPAARASAGAGGWLHELGGPDAGRGRGVELFIPADCLVHALFVVLLPRIVINWHVLAGVAPARYAAVAGRGSRAMLPCRAVSQAGARTRPRAAPGRQRHRLVPGSRARLQERAGQPPGSPAWRPTGRRAAAASPWRARRSGRPGAGADAALRSWTTGSWRCIARRRLGAGRRATGRGANRGRDGTFAGPFGPSWMGRAAV